MKKKEMKGINMENKSPVLAQPGAGLPWFQSLLLRFFMGPVVAAKSDQKRNAETFRRLNEKVLALVADISESQLDTPVLVPPQVGLEDSSRYWSIAMTLEHMVIVNSAVGKLIRALAKGVSPDVKVDIARIKPVGAKDAQDIIREFREVIGRVEFPETDSPSTLHHPWFGPMNARQWSWLLAWHTRLHYRQLKKIREGLGYTMH